MGKDKPAWVQAFITRAWKSVHIHDKLAKAREDHYLEHQRVIRNLESPHMPPGNTIDLVKAADRIVISSIPAPITGDEWEAISAWHKETARTLSGLTYATEHLCDDCLTKIGESGVMDLAEDDALIGAISSVFEMIERVSKQTNDRKQQRRRFLRILEDMVENGTTTTIRVSDNGYITAEHGGLTVGTLSQNAG